MITATPSPCFIFALKFAAIFAPLKWYRQPHFAERHGKGFTHPVFYCSNVTSPSLASSLYSLPIGLPACFQTSIRTSLLHPSYPQPANSVVLEPTIASLLYLPSHKTKQRNPKVGFAINFSEPKRPVMGLASASTQYNSHPRISIPLNSIVPHNP